MGAYDLSDVHPLSRWSSCLAGHMCSCKFHYILTHNTLSDVNNWLHIQSVLFTLW